MFVDAQQARAAARREIAAGPAADDPAFDAWRDASAGDPLVVHDNAGRPSYWLVPVCAAGGVVGAVRVAGDGRPVASVAQRAGAAITTIDAAEVQRRARDRIHTSTGDVVGQVLLVHDGPPGREAWRVEVMHAGRAVRWVFVTPGGSYERPAGEDDPGLEGGTSVSRAGRPLLHHGMVIVERRAQYGRADTSS